MIKFKHMPLESGKAILEELYNKMDTTYKQALFTKRKIREATLA